MCFVDNITVKKSNKVILSNITFDIKKNEILCILWHNWSWKTTLLKILMGIESITSWFIKYSRKLKFWYVPQYYTKEQNIPLNVTEYIWIYKSWSKDSVISWLQFFGALHLLKQNVYWLSGGEMQKLLISIAMADNPSILLLDEPTNWLDA